MNTVRYFKNTYIFLEISFLYPRILRNISEREVSFYAPLLTYAERLCQLMLILPLEKTTYICQKKRYRRIKVPVLFVKEYECIRFCTLIQKRLSILKSFWRSKKKRSEIMVKFLENIQNRFVIIFLITNLFWIFYSIYLVNINSYIHVLLVELRSKFLPFMLIDIVKSSDSLVVWV